MPAAKKAGTVIRKNFIKKDFIRNIEVTLKERKNKNKIETLFVKKITG